MASYAYESGQYTETCNQASEETLVRRIIAPLMLRKTVDAPPSLPPPALVRSQPRTPPNTRRVEIVERKMSRLRHKDTNDYVSSIMRYKKAYSGARKFSSAVCSKITYYTLSITNANNRRHLRHRLPRCRRSYLFLC